MSMDLPSNWSATDVSIVKQVMNDTVYSDVGQLKVNNKVMCQMSMKLPTFDQNTPHTLIK